jgi:sporulation protein YlmC with PRC-barrel domain
VNGGDLIGIAHHVLDHQLLDSRGMRCGKVDDVGLAWDGEGRLEVRSVLAGPGTLRRRVDGPVLRWLVGLAGDREVAVPWEQVSGIDDHVQLALPAAPLGLAQGEERAADFLSRVLGSQAHAVRTSPQDVAEDVYPDLEVIRLTGLLGCEAIGEDGTHRGCVHEFTARKAGRMLGEAAGNAWIVLGVATGRGATAARLGRDRSAASVWPVVALPEAPGDPIRVANEPVTPREG